MSQFSWISNCSSWFGKVMNSFACMQSESDTAAMRLDTDDWEIQCEVAVNVWKEPVARKWSDTASWVKVGIGWDLIVYQRRDPTIFSCNCILLVILYLLINSVSLHAPRGFNLSRNTLCLFKLLAVLRIHQLDFILRYERISNLLQYLSVYPLQVLSNWQNKRKNI